MTRAYVATDNNLSVVLFNKAQRDISPQTNRIAKLTSLHRQWSLLVVRWLFGLFVGCLVVVVTAQIENAATQSR